MSEVQTTFVPRRPQLATPRVAAPRGPDFIVLIATVLFFASAAAAGGVYAWRWNLNREIESQADQLEKVRDSFDPKFIEQASLLNDRIVAANKILDGHLAPTELFDIFEQFTLRTVAFQSFTAVRGANGSVALTATGVGKNFEAVVLQSDWFGDGPDGDGARLKDVVFSRLGETDRREATFNFSATIPAERILFTRSITQVPAPIQAPAQRGAAASSTSTSLAATSTAPAVSTPGGVRTPPPGSTTI